jgi:hypothetical protein
MSKTVFSVDFNRNEDGTFETRTLLEPYVCPDMENRIVIKIEEEYAFGVKVVTVFYDQDSCEEEITNAFKIWRKND